MTRLDKHIDSRAHGFEGELFAFAAIPPKTLRAMVRETIEEHIDEEALLAPSHSRRLTEGSSTGVKHIRTAG